MTPNFDVVLLVGGAFFAGLLLGIRLGAFGEHRWGRNAEFVRDLADRLERAIRLNAGRHGLDGK